LKVFFWTEPGALFPTRQYLNQSTMPSTCSYCCGIGHRIRQCDSENLESKWRDAIYRVVHAPTVDDLFSPDHIAHAKWAMRRVDSKLLRSISARFCGGKVSETKPIAMDRIIGKIAENYDEWALNDQLPVRMEHLPWVPHPTFLEATGTRHEDFHGFRQQVQEPTPVPRRHIQLALLALDEGTEDLTVEVDCPICFEDKPKFMMLSTTCNHDFCAGCMCQHLKTSKQTACPMCRTEIKTIWARDPDCYAEVRNAFNH